MEKLLHIDFSYILGDDPKHLKVEMKITEDMLQMLGGQNSESFKIFKKYCKEAYKLLRQRSSLWYILLTYLEFSVPSIDKFKYNSETIRNHVIERLIPGESDIEASMQIIDIVERSSYTTWGQNLVIGLIQLEILCVILKQVYLIVIHNLIWTYNIYESSDSINLRELSEDYTEKALRKEQLDKESFYNKLFNSKVRNERRALKKQTKQKREMYIYNYIRKRYPKEDPSNPSKEAKKAASDSFNNKIEGIIYFKNEEIKRKNNLRKKQLEKQAKQNQARLERTNNECLKNKN